MLGVTICVVFVAIKFTKQREPMTTMKLKPSLLNLSEQMRPINSNSHRVSSSHGLPPMDTMSGEMPRAVENFQDESFFPF
jgi:hypothetical protein